MEGKKEEKVNRKHPFDQMMFGGPRTRLDSETKTEDSSKGNKTNDEDNSFDLFNTAQTMAETYKQLSPYVKGASGIFKKFKS
ncbi:YppG family protein [Aquibacillus koreensis]|uniref:YppG family protein n=1 Tax=Aquibacillus koreensis TaxID=279446 RepID=A0A9X3WJJ1_9BACI|nr:YppG family protein [Aquibacillus koreensis]MCT2535642.1 YppG family protein [Aquibacillus koreensis]MDC3420073.1 YppG family protein [Aquibacillus koreensis]